MRADLITQNMDNSQADFSPFINPQQIIDLMVIKVIGEAEGEPKGLEGQDQVFDEMTRVKEVISVWTLTIFPCTPEEYGRQKKG